VISNCEGFNRAEHLSHADRVFEQYIKDSLNYSCTINLLS
jgi:hypothetical protein